MRFLRRAQALLIMRFLRRAWHQSNIELTVWARAVGARRGAQPRTLPLPGGRPPRTPPYHPFRTFLWGAPAPAADCAEKAPNLVFWLSP
jgi:hypothetical protein